ncbi:MULTISPECIES: FxsA family protein [unclassified Devosia]|uniref:FxsA family protein n=1 Tax=unclassified Devosia TaxID=196773 RepID=UPI00145FC28E|nr:FxsA family protein [Devosia sp. MC521]MBJ6988572.1 membrane protein FxsA [Devosia sp. MC521]QMW62624.1 membrane protein FxsA [Devosia sp. MC521]
MGRFILFGFIALPLLEIAMFVVVGRAIGLLPTLGLVILAAVLGGFLLRQQGLGAINRLRTNVNQGTVPGRTMFDATMIGVAAMFLLIPGFISDIVALLLLLPTVRGFLFGQLAKNVTVVETTTSYRRADESYDFRAEPQRTIDLDKDDWRKDG